MGNLNYQNRLGFFRKLAIGAIGGLASILGTYNLSCSPKDITESLPGIRIVESQRSTNDLEQEINKSDYRTKDITPPEVKFYAYPREGDAPLKVSFLGSGYDRQSGISGFAFDFDNDGVNDNIDNFRIRGNDITGTHIYERPGTFTPRLTVTNGAGLSSSSTMWEINVRGDFTTPSNLRIVDLNADGENNGRKWKDSYVNLRSALEEATSNPEINEIWVARGTYRPSNTGNRSATFRLINNVKVYGGFSGTETALNQRDFLNNKTILSGDINGDDLPNFTNRGDNSLHVVTGSGTNSDTVLDGFTIKGGNSNIDGMGGDDRGAGLINYSGGLILRNVTFTDNLSGDNSAGMFSDGGSATLENCLFVGNRANHGAGMVNQTRSTTKLVNCSFIDNTAHGLKDPRLGGGGLYNSTSNTALTNCSFIGNSANYGAGMANWDSSPNLINCLFMGNIANIKGGAVLNSGSGGTGSHPTFVNCTIKDNEAMTKGGGIANVLGILVDGRGGSANLSNSILWGNVDSAGLNESSQVFDDGTGVISANNSCIQGLTGNLGGASNIGSNPLFSDLDGRLSSGSPCKDAGDNSAVPSEIITDLDGNPRIVNGTVDIGAYEIQ